MARTGRPSGINEKIKEKIYALAKEGKTELQIARAIGISPRTLGNWKARHPDFLPTLKKAKNVADELVEASLFQRAIGYTHKEVKVFFDSKNGTCVEHVVEKHYPPEVLAQIFWLKNRQPEHWRDRVEARVDAQIKGDVVVYEAEWGATQDVIKDKEGSNQ